MSVWMPDFVMVIGFAGEIRIPFAPALSVCFAMTNVAHVSVCEKQKRQNTYKSRTPQFWWQSYRRRVFLDFTIVGPYDRKYILQYLSSRVHDAYDNSTRMTIVKAFSSAFNKSEMVVRKHPRSKASNAAWFRREKIMITVLVRCHEATR